MDFQNSPPFEKSACFYVTISGNFESYQYLNFETDFLENENFFQKTGAPFFSWKLKLSYQKPMLRQIEWREQNGYIAKNGVLPVTTSFFLKKIFSSRTFCRVDLMYQRPKFPWVYLRRSYSFLSYQLTCSTFNKHYCKDKNHRYINNL